MKNNLYALVVIAGVLFLSVSSVPAAPPKQQQSLSQPGQSQPAAQPDLVAHITNTVGGAYTGLGGCPRISIFSQIEASRKISTVI